MQSNQEDFVCKTCWNQDVDPEFCGVFLVTRSWALIGKKTDQTVLTKKLQLILKKHNHLLINDKVWGLECKIIAYNKKVTNCSLIKSPGDYEYLLKKPTMTKELYSQLLNQHSNWIVSFRLFMNLVHAIISFLLMTKKCNTNYNLEAETWRCIILTSQKCFPPPTIKSANTVLLNDMLVSNFNIHMNDSNNKPCRWTNSQASELQP